MSRKRNVIALLERAALYASHGPGISSPSKQESPKLRSADADAEEAHWMTKTLGN